MPPAKSLFRAPKEVRREDAGADRKPLSSGDKIKDKEKVEELAQRIAMLQDVLYAERRHKLLVVLQGMDTSGKDGTIKGVFGKIDPLGIRTVAFKAPTQVEKEHDFLWRIHREVPGQGEIVIFNRSHYEDVLVPLVHGWIDKEECERRYGHIRDFEKMLSQTGTVLIKCFLHISRKEQKRRLEERIADPNKHWKFDPQDLVEREYWDQYQDAYARAIAQTDSDHAPWYVIPADSKTHRNLAIASVVLETLEGLNIAYPPPNPKLANIKIN